MFVPPRATDSWPEKPSVRFCPAIDPVMFVSLVTACTTLLFNLPAAKVPTHTGEKVWVFADEVMVSWRFVSEEVARVCAAPVCAEPKVLVREVMAEVR